MAPPQRCGGAVPSVPMGTTAEPTVGGATLAQIADEIRGCTRCALSVGRTTHGPRRGECAERRAPRRRGAGSARGRHRAPVRRTGGRAALRAAARDRLGTRGRVHHQRREVPAARQPRPRAGGDRDLRARTSSARSRRSTRRSWSRSGGTPSSATCPARGSARCTGGCAAPTRASTSSRCTILLRRCTRPRCARRCSATSEGCRRRCWRRAGRAR